MKKCVFIIPYFGKMNNYFELFLKSCAYNSEFDWLIFTDDKSEYNYPNNVNVQYCKFSDIDKLIYEKIGFHVYEPYKLCDYKPAYGYIFSSYIKDYKMWGYCDTDLIFGNLSKWITNEILERYDKIGILGHLTLIKNSEIHNKVFMDSINGKSWYKEVFSSNDNKFFDEAGGNSINTLFRQRKMKIFYDFPIADIYTLSSKFRIVTHSSESKYCVENYKENFFSWNRGNLIRYYLKNAELFCKDYMYIHLQKRNMKLNLNSLDFDEYKIIPNKFENIEDIPCSCEDFKNIHRYDFNFQWLRVKKIHCEIKLKKISNVVKVFFK